MTHILRIDASARREGSITRLLADQITTRLGGTVTFRDLTNPIPQLDEAWITANFTPADQRSVEQRAQLALSDTLIEELRVADVVVIGVPIYNFGVPSALKAWIDQVARVGVTFQYSETGPKGLLTGKRAILAVASGGTPSGSDIDFATGYLRHVLGFIGITEVDVIAADELGNDAETKLAAANDKIAALPKAA